MAGRTDDGFAALCATPVDKLARVLDVVDDLSALMRAENVFRKKHHEAVRVNDFAGIRHDAEPVAVKREAVIGADFFHLVDQSLKILRLGRGRMVVREVSVNIAVKWNDFNVKLRENAKHRRADDAVAGIDCDLELTKKSHTFERLLDIRSNGIDKLDAAGLFCDAPALPFDPFTNALNLIDKERDVRYHHLQAVVLRGIVRARHCDAYTAIEVLRCVIANGSRYGADVQNILAGQGNLLQKGVLKSFNRESAVPADAETLDARVMRHDD